MLRMVCSLAALFAVMFIPAAHAQPKICKKVDVSFACRNGGGGTATFNCRRGETEAKCCARYRRRAADPRRGWCTGRGNGLISFKCGCANAKIRKRGGRGSDAEASIRRTSPDATDPDSSDAAPARRLQVQNIGSSGQDGLKSARACRQVKYKFSCRGPGGAKGKAACRRGEGKAACCKRVAQLARRSCARSGGVSRFKCECTKKGGRGPRGPDRLGLPEPEPRAKKGGNVEFEWKVEEGESDKPGPGLRGRRSGREGARRCPKVRYAFSCRRRGKGSGKADCRRGESERRCCARVRQTVRETCARNGGVRRFRCGCPGRPQGGRRNPLERRR